MPRRLCLLFDERWRLATPELTILITIAYLVAALACLYGPFVGDVWVGTKGQVLFNAGIPLALVTASQIAFRERLCRTPTWGVVLSVSWMSLLICVPGAWPDDLLVQAVSIGALLTLSALGVFLAAAIGPLRDVTIHLAVRVVYGLAILGVGVVFLRSGLRTIGSLDGGVLAELPEEVELFRTVVSALAALIVVAGVADWALVARRRTRR